MSPHAHTTIRLTLLALAITLLLGRAVVCRADAALGEAPVGDVPMKRTGTDRPEGRATALFPHWRHRLFFTCNVCHPAIFPMQGGETVVTMDDIQEGKYCGVCHNGKIAWAVTIGSCSRCHAPR